MYHTKAAMEADLSQTHTPLTKKPWNVKPGDILILSQYGMGFMNSGFIPVEITSAVSYPEFNYDPITRNYSRKTYRYTHKAFSPSDTHRLIGWHTYNAYTYDDVEIWRPTKR